MLGKCKVVSTIAIAVGKRGEREEGSIGASSYR